MLQQTFRGHGLSVLMLVPAGGMTVPGFRGPQTALSMGIGKGGVPELRQMMVSFQNWSLAQPAQPHVFFLLNESNSPSDMPYAASMLPQVSPSLTT